MIMPAAALVLPIFLELNAVHLIGSVLSVILPFSFFPFGVYLAYIYYATAVPRDLLDAARVDGCGEWQTFRRVALPLAKPVVALVFFFSFVADWNNFFLPYAVLADSSQYPIQVGLSDLLSSTPSFNPAARWRRAAGEHLPAGAGARRTARRRAGRHRVHGLAASPRARDRRRRGEGVKITGYRSLMAQHEWGRRIGDVNYVSTADPHPRPRRWSSRRTRASRGSGWATTRTSPELFEALEGEDPRGVVALYDRLCDYVFKLSHQGSVASTIGALDMALWDIKAKAAGEPLWRLLGARDRLRARATRHRSTSR